MSQRYTTDHIGNKAVYREEPGLGGYHAPEWQATVGAVLTCPACRIKGTPAFFGESCAGECFCPCGEAFLFEGEDEDEDD